MSGADTFHPLIARLCPSNPLTPHLGRISQLVPRIRKPPPRSPPIIINVMHIDKFSWASSRRQGCMDSDLTSAEPCAARIIRGFFCALRRGVSSDPSQTRGLIASIFDFQFSAVKTIIYAMCTMHCLGTERFRFCRQDCSLCHTACKHFPYQVDTREVLWRDFERFMLNGYD
jgi:hypothetical protein